MEAVVDNYSGDDSIVQEAKSKLEKVKQKDANNSLLAPETIPGSNGEGELEMEEDGGQ